MAEAHALEVPPSPRAHLGPMRTSCSCGEWAVLRWTYAGARKAHWQHILAALSQQL